MSKTAPAFHFTRNKSGSVIDWTGVKAVSLENLAIVSAVAFAAPLLLGFAPWLRAPSTRLDGRPAVGSS